MQKRILPGDEKEMRRLAQTKCVTRSGYKDKSAGQKAADAAV